MNNEDKIVDLALNQYFKSADYNGYHAYYLPQLLSLSTNEIKELLKNLLKSEKIDCAIDTFHPNPHIKAFSWIPIEKQIEEVSKVEDLRSVCVYPSKSTLANNPTLQSLSNKPYTLKIASGCGQLDFAVFDLSVLENYRNDPRYEFETDFINGSIAIHSEEVDLVKKSDCVFLKTFGFAFDDDMNRYVAVYLRYLADLSPEHQQIWNSKELIGDFKLHPDYYRNSILGEWSEKISIFDAYMEEFAVINVMAKLLGKPKLFRDDFSNGKPENFGFLLRPTKKEYFESIHLLDKILSENINKDFFKGDIDLESDEPRADGKIVVTQKGTIRLLEEWIRLKFKPSEPEIMNKAFAILKKIRKERQKPAHGLNENEFNVKYSSDQRKLILEGYEALRTLRLILANHPKIKADPPEISSELFKGLIWNY